MYRKLILRKNHSGNTETSTTVRIWVEQIGKYSNQHNYYSMGNLLNGSLNYSHDQYTNKMFSQKFQATAPLSYRKNPSLKQN